MFGSKLHSGVGILAVGLLALPGTASSAEPTKVTFSKDVAPIFQAKCVNCHEPGSIAPMSLRTFEESRPWARSIKQRVQTRQMPPWHINQSVGVQKFKNDMSLSQEQIDTIVAWVDGGAPQGDPKDLPPLKPVTTTLFWQGERDGYGPPDVVISSPMYTMPAVSQDQWWRPISEIPITEPKWVRMIEIRPANIQGRKILHHSVAYLVQNPNDPDTEFVNTGLAVGGRTATPTADQLANSRPFLMEWAIGKGYDRYADGSGKLLKPGEKIAWDEHIHAVGEEITSGSELGIWFYPKGQEPKKRAHLVGFTGLKNGAEGLDIPPNSIAHTEGFTVLKENTVITNFQPHFHLRGKAMMVEAIMPDGKHEVVSYVDNFNFNWMTNYIYDEDAAPVYPKGTVIHVSAYYDNTTNNKNNPDPNQWVGYGDRTVDEMAHAWMNVYYLTDDEYKELVAKRGGRVGVNNPQVQRTQQQQ
ncbi:MAG: cytochrome c [Vicinamibacterales bacterium]